MQMDHTEHGSHRKEAGHDSMVADYRRRFWTCLLLTLPVLLLSPNVRGLFGFRDALAFTGDKYVVFGLCTLIFFYGGWPFLKGITEEIRKREPGMMTLIALRR